MKNALAVLAGIAVGLPVMAALASANGHTAGALPDHYVPWAQHRLRPGWAAIRAPEPGHSPEAPRRAHALVSVSPRVATSTPPEHAPSPPSGERPAVHAGHSGRPGHAGYAVPGAGLRVSIEAPRRVKPGGTYAYRVKLANRGPGTPGEITVRSTLPEGVERTGTSLPDGVGGYAGGRDATLVMPRLAPGTSATARFVVRVRRGARGRLVARSRIAYVGGERAPRTGGNVSTVATRVR